MESLMRIEEKIEVTEEMLDAGRDVVISWDVISCDESLTELYRAMEKARLTSEQSHGR
jgi:hypothetical protein